MKSYRYPTEQWILALTLVAILVIIFFTAWATICLVPILVLTLIVIVYFSNQSYHVNLMKQSVMVSEEKTPRLAQLTRECMVRLQPGSPVDYFVLPNRVLNAYTFGFSNPKSVVLYSSLLEVMDEDELRFIIGHELGHVALDHTWLNTLLGGMSGIPMSIGSAILMTLAFRWWNRACEYSADRAGLLACGKPQKALTALVKLVNPGINTTDELQRTLQVIDKEDDSVLNQLAESVATHPMMIRRIEQLRLYAATPEYRELQQRINLLQVQH
jgi:Zn-dependent protease with chaperone function